MAWSKVYEDAAGGAGSLAGTRVRDAVTRIYIRRNMIAWPATEPTNSKRPESWALVFIKEVKSWQVKQALEDILYIRF